MYFNLISIKSSLLKVILVTWIPIAAIPKCLYALKIHIFFSKSFLSVWARLLFYWEDEGPVTWVTSTPHPSTAISNSTCISQKMLVLSLLPVPLHPSYSIHHKCCWPYLLNSPQNCTLISISIIRIAHVSITSCLNQCSRVLVDVFRISLSISS